MYAAPLPRLIKKANRQVASTKELLNTPKARGLLWVASDGNKDLLPDVIWFLLERVLSKRSPDGTLQYRNIDGVIYFNPRMPVEEVGGKGRTFLWLWTVRNPLDTELKKVLEELSEAWAAFVEHCLVAGPVVREHGAPGPVRFLGVEPRIPHINLSGASTRKSNK